MDVFVRDLPDQMTEKDLNRLLSPYLHKIGITTWKCHRLRTKGCATVTIHNIDKANQFLHLHGQGQHGSSRTREPIKHVSGFAKFKPSKWPVDPFLTRSLEREEKEKKIESLAPKALNLKSKTKPIPRVYKMRELWCGQWDYHGDDLIFQDYYHVGRKGEISFGSKSLFVRLAQISEEGVQLPESQLEISYLSIESCTTGSQGDPSITFSLRYPPKFFEKIEKIDGTETTSGDQLANLIKQMLIKERKESPIKRKRVTSLDQAHASVAAACLCYRFQLQDFADIRAVQSLKCYREIPSSISYPTRVVTGSPFAGQMSVLNHRLATLEKMSFDLRFQLQRLGQNGSLPPYKVSELLIAINSLITPENNQAFVDAVYLLYDQIPFPGPNTEASTVDITTLIEQVIKNRDHIDKGQSYRENWEQYEHLILVHKANVTPAGISLSGPQPEVKNRVLRKYAKYPNNFLSVFFSEEDGERIRHDRQTSTEEVYRSRFKHVLDGTINIAGRPYQFLGFSHSSLRAHTCWFMAPFVADGSLIYARGVIQGLGDFDGFRSPAKCAARIGQAFSQTLSSIRVPPESIQTMPDIERNGRTFSDGVGVCSKDVLLKIWDKYSTAHGLKPTAIQVRIQGAKGMISLDSNLPGLMVKLRPSMIKFEGTGVSDIEICGSAMKPLRMVLNHQLIKIFEDLGVKEDTSIALQDKAVDQLRSTTLSADSAASFLDHHSIGGAAGIPWLIRKLWDLGLIFSNDHFLRNTLELAVLARLREMRYKARIPVEKGVTLYGIMDETGILEEGEIYCTFGTQVIEGNVVITRSPALHPGDIRVVNAVDVPSKSPLCDLNNVVVFSQKGPRDLPSMLSGGDLDGDLYNVIYDADFYPEKTYPPADYTAPPAVDIGRTVEASDMTDHFLSFMENDTLGLIAILHKIMADRSPEGVLDDDCVLLASLHSKAVDFSKTGRPVLFEEIPPYPKARPDFLTNGPRVTIDQKSILLAEDTKFDVDDDMNGPEELAEMLSYESPTVYYYESQKVLGKLYRKIDEHSFLEEVQKQTQS